MLTTERKVYVAVLGLGLAALGADQLFFGSGAGSPSEAAASIASSDAQTASAAPDAPRPARVQASASPAILTVAHRIEVMETRDGPPAPSTVDAFAPGAPFRALLTTAQSEKPAEKSAPTTGPEKLIEQFRVTMIVLGKGNGTEARAFIKGSSEESPKMRSIGDVIDGFTIAAIRKTDEKLDVVELTLDGKTWVLSVPRPDNAR